MSVRILTGDCRELLRTLPDESVHCVVTSPPYWGLRDYGVGGQLGMERTLGEHVETMTDVFREVRRVLRSDGTLWLNYGDSYAASVNGRSAADTKAAGNDDRTFRDKPFSTIGPISRVGASGNKGNGGADHHFRVTASGYLKPKDLCGIPWRVAFALQADGWYLRQDIIWSKPNPMPESVRDRCTKAHEYLFLLAKSERYFYDAEAIAETSVAAWEIDQARRQQRVNATGGAISGGTGETVSSGTTRNKRSVWEVGTHAYPDAHFATFPPALIEPCILAGCPKQCCAKCGAPWAREVEEGAAVGRRDNGTGDQFVDLGMSTGRAGARDRRTIGFSPSCACNADAVPGTVLDPFGGAGTTGLVADRLQRNATLIELNPAYVAMATERLRGDAPLFYETTPGLSGLTTVDDGAQSD